MTVVDDTMWAGMIRMRDSPNAIERETVLNFVALCLAEGWLSEGTAANFFGGRLEARAATAALRQRIGGLLSDE